MELNFVWWAHYKIIVISYINPKVFLQSCDGKNIYISPGANDWFWGPTFNHEGTTWIWYQMKEHILKFFEMGFLCPNSCQIFCNEVKGQRPLVKILTLIWTSLVNTFYIINSLL